MNKVVIESIIEMLEKEESVHPVMDMETLKKAEDMLKNLGCHGTPDNFF
jgi:hypothetical protein